MFLPPETWLTQKFHGKPVDIWALGITFYFLAVGTYPFNTTDMSQFNKIVETQPIKYPERVNSGLSALIDKMTKKNPNDRITLHGAMEDPWITKNNEFPMEKIDPEAHKITVTKSDIQNALAVRRLETNLFVLSKLKGRYTQTKTRMAGQDTN